MNSAQKTIKYVATGFAYLLAFSIIAGIVAAVMGIMTGIGVIGRHAPELDIDCNKYDKCLSVSLAGSDLVIKSGDKLDFESENDKLEVSRGDNRLTIVDKSKGGWSWFGHNNRKTVTITVPEGMEFDMIGVAAGAGKISAESIITKDLKLDLGAGETVVDYIRATGDVKIDTGVGRFEIKEGLLKNAGIHLGIGSTEISAILSGDSKVDAGIGSVKLDLGLPESDYTFKVDKGIGKVVINGNEYSDGSKVGSGENVLDVDGGIGEIVIKTAKATEKVETVKNAEELEKTDEKAEKTEETGESEEIKETPESQPGVHIEAPED